MLRVEDPKMQVAVNALFAVGVGILFTVFLLGLMSCAVQAQATTPVPDPLADLLAGLDPVTTLVSRLAGAGAGIYLLVEGAKRHVPVLNAGTERAGLYLYLTALALGVVAGLAGSVEPMPGAEIPGRIFSGLCSGTIAVAFHSGKRAWTKAKAEKRAPREENFDE